MTDFRRDASSATLKGFTRAVFTAPFAILLLGFGIEARYYGFNPTLALVGLYPWPSCAAFLQAYLPMSAVFAIVVALGLIQLPGYGAYLGWKAARNRLRSGSLVLAAFHISGIFIWELRSHLSIFD